jgi:hypothetical protein
MLLIEKIKFWCLLSTYYGATLNLWGRTCVTGQQCATVMSYVVIMLDIVNYMNRSAGHYRPTLDISRASGQASGKLVFWDGNYISELNNSSRVETN